MKKLLSLLFLVPSISLAASLNSFWIGDGSLKQPQGDQWPSDCTSSTCTTSRYWDGTTGKNFGFLNETISYVLTMYNNGGVDITSATVVMSNLTSGASVISSTAVLCSGVTDYTQRPIEEFWVNYSSIIGNSRFLANQDSFEQKDEPPQFRRPCTDTDQGNDYTGIDRHSCIPNGGTTFSSRPDANKYYPDALVPMECAGPTFTVKAGKSQSVWHDVYLAKTLTPGTTYTGTITVSFGATVSTTIPVALEVKKGFTMPDQPGLPVIGYVETGKIDTRHSSSNAVLTHKHYYQLLHRNGVIPIGNYTDCGADTVDYPCPEYQVQLTGSLFTSGNGYGNGRGINTGTGWYSIGTYAGWPGEGTPAWSTTDAQNFCTNVSSWATNMGNLAPNATSFVYLEDEALNNAPTYSQWMSTVTTCQVAHEPKAFVTSPYPSIFTNAPYINMPTAGTWMGVSSATYQTDFSSYTKTPGSLASAYNGDSPWVGTSLRTEEPGFWSTLGPWAYFKKGFNGLYFIWDVTYWSGSCGTTDLFNSACTFNCCSPTVSSVFGLTNGSWGNGDGNLLYPGHDVTHTPDYGFDGPIASWRLKMLRRGIQDYDYITKANTINPSSTTAIVSNQVPSILMEQYCFTTGDCTYRYGGYSWSDDPGVLAWNRELLANIIASVNPTPPISCQGGITATGKMTLQ